jgi:hypothetical protein
MARRAAVLTEIKCFPAFSAPLRAIPLKTLFLYLFLKNKWISLYLNT